MAISRKKIYECLKGFYKKYNKYIRLCLILGAFFFCNGFTPAYAGKYPELMPLLNLLSFFINLIRFCSGGLAGIIATICGWNVMTNTSGQGIKTAKTTLVQVLIGLTIVFFGSSGADFLLDRLIGILS